MSLYERTGGTWAVYRNGAWEMGVVRAASLFVDGEQVVGQRAGAIDSPSGGTVVDSESRAAIDAVLNALRTHGLIDT
jgi:hypothetical protein